MKGEGEKGMSAQRNDEPQYAQQPPYTQQRQIAELKGQKKPIYKKVWFWVIVVVVLIAGAASQSIQDQGTTIAESETPTTQSAGDAGTIPEVAATPTYTLPPEAEFAAYVEEKLYSAIDSEVLYLDTILTRPVEIEIAEYSLSNDKPDLRVNAIVSEYEVGEYNGPQLTKEIVRICLAWLQDQGFDPYNDWIMPTSWVMKAEKGETGQETWRVWGSSHYDWNNDLIEWEEFNGL